MSGGDLAGSFCQGLNGNCDLFGEVQRRPGSGEKQKNRKKGQCQQNLPFKRAYSLVLDGIRRRLHLDILKALEKIGWQALRDKQEPGPKRSSRGEKGSGSRIPHL